MEVISSLTILESLLLKKTLLVHSGQQLKVLLTFVHRRLLQLRFCTRILPVFPICLLLTLPRSTRTTIKPQFRPRMAYTRIPTRSIRRPSIPWDPPIMESSPTCRCRLHLLVELFYLLVRLEPLMISHLRTAMLSFAPLVTTSFVSVEELSDSPFCKFHWESRVANYGCR